MVQWWGWGCSSLPNVACAMCGLSLLLVLVLLRVFFLHILWFSSLYNNQYIYIPIIQDRGLTWKLAKSDVASSLNIVEMPASYNESCSFFWVYPSSFGKVLNVIILWVTNCFKTAMVIFGVKSWSNLLYIIYWTWSLWVFVVSCPFIADLWFMEG